MSILSKVSRYRNSFIFYWFALSVRFLKHYFNRSPTIKIKESLLSSTYKKTLQFSQICKLCKQVKRKQVVILGMLLYLIIVKEKDGLYKVHVFNNLSVKPKKCNKCIGRTKFLISLHMFDNL